MPTHIDTAGAVLNMLVVVLFVLPDSEQPAVVAVVAADG